MNSDSNDEIVNIGLLHHQKWQKYWQKMKKKLAQLEFNPFATLHDEIEP